MFELPIDKDALPFAIPAGGSLRLNTLRDVREDRPFDEELARGEDRLLALEVVDGQRLALVPAGEIALRFEAGAIVDIVWPDEPEAQREVLRTYDLALDEDHVYLALIADATAGFDASADFPAGPLSSAIGIRAGGHIGYVYLRKFERAAPAGEVLRTFFRGWRLPHHVGQPLAGALGGLHLPEEGEVIALQYGGYLSLRAATSWGYRVSKSAEAEVGRLALRGRARVEAAATLRAGLDIAGTWGVEVRKGRQDGWARVIVRKHRESVLNVAADLRVRAEIETDGLPSTAGEFLEAALDLHTPDVVRDALGVLDDPDAFLERLEDGANGLTEKFARALAGRVLDEPLSRRTASAFFAALEDIRDAYDDLERLDEALGASALAVLERYASRADVVQRVLERMAGLRDRAAMLDEVTDAEFWDLLRLYLGERFAALLTRDDVFEAVKAELGDLASTAWQRVAALIEARRAAFGADALLADLKALLGDLEEIDTPDRLRAKAERYLLEVVERLTGKAFEKLRAAELPQALEELKTLVDQLGRFGPGLYASFERALNDAYKLEVSRSYTRATERDALIDVEVNVGADGGAQLLQAALRGDFDRVLLGYDPAVVRVNPSVFTHEVRTAHELQVNLLGWRHGSLREVVVNVEERVREQGGGLIHVYALTGTSEVRQARRDEEVKMRFLFQLFAEGRNRAVIDTVSHLTASYEYEVQDRRTTEEELREYLHLAQALHLLPDGVEAVIERFREELAVSDGNWGAVRAAYRVQYDPDALLEVFRWVPSGQMEWTARQAFRAVLASHFRRSYAGWAFYESLARVVRDEATYQRWKQKGDAYFRTDVFGDLAYPVAGEAVPVTLSHTARIRLLNVYHAEDRYVGALLGLDEVLDAARAQSVPPSKAELEEAFTRFVEAGRDLMRKTGLWKGGVGGVGGEKRYADPLFAILDQLIIVASGGRAQTSTLELEFQLGDERVTKIFAA